MKKFSIFLIHFAMGGMRNIFMLILSLILVIVGLIWWDVCQYIGMGILILFLLICLISGLNGYRVMTRPSGNPELDEAMKRLSDDPKAFFADAMGASVKNRSLHGEDLLVLSDEELFQTVYFQSIDMVENTENELEQLAGARRTAYILSTFDAEIQNGGLCQFFVNSSGECAPYVSECLKKVEAEDHRRLYDDFIVNNGINVADLDSFKVNSRHGYIKQTKRFDYDSFDDKYYELSPLQEKITAYIRSNINEF